MFFPFISTVWITAYVNQFNFSIFRILSDHKNCFFISTLLALNFFPWHGWILAEILICIDSLKLMGVKYIDSVLSPSSTINSHLKIAVLSWTSVSQMSINYTWMKSIMTILTEIDCIALVQIQAKLMIILEHY